MWHGYIALQDLGMNQTQRQTLWQVFKDLSPATLDNQPKHLNQFRLSLDEKKAILELLFDDEDVSISAFRIMLANTFDVSYVMITWNTTRREYGWSWTPIWTFGRNGTNYFRVALFGGVGADWLQSKDAALDYLRQNIEDWEQPDG